MHTDTAATITLMGSCSNEEAIGYVLAALADRYPECRPDARAVRLNRRTVAVTVGTDAGLLAGTVQRFADHPTAAENARIDGIGHAVGILGYDAGKVYVGNEPELSNHRAGPPVG